MHAELNDARRIRLICLLFYGCLAIVSACIWFLVFVLKKEQLVPVLVPLFFILLMTSFVSSNNAVSLRCPKCERRFFCQTKNIFGLNMFAARCCHCRLPLYRK